MEIKTLIVIYLPIHGANDTEKYKMFKMQLYNILVKRFTQNVKHDMSIWQNTGTHCSMSTLFGYKWIQIKW